MTDAFVKQGRYYRVRYDTAKRRLFALHMWDADRVLTRWESTGTNARYNMILTEVTPEGDLTKEETLEKFWRPHLGTLKGSDGKPRKDDAGHVLRESLDVAALEPTMAKAVAIAGTSDETWPLFRVDRAARWNTMHLFLSHLWDAWSVADGIPQRYQQPYAVEKLGHSVVIERPMPDEDGVI